MGMGRSHTNVVTLNFGSFPRSANHFTFDILTKAFGDDKINVLLHSIYKLQQADQVITTVRSPRECIPSWITFMNDQRPNRTNRISEWYRAYYQAVIEKDLLAFTFEDITKRTNQCLQIIAERFEMPLINSNPTYDLDTGFHQPTSDKSRFEDLIHELEKDVNYSQTMQIYEQAASKCHGIKA